MRHRFLGAAFAVLLLVPAACDLTDPDIDADGVVRFIQVEGGCWVIDSGDQRLEPINLSAEFQVDGLAVTFEATRRTDLASICQVGDIVELSGGSDEAGEGVEEAGDGLKKGGEHGKLR